MNEIIFIGIISGIISGLVTQYFILKALNMFFEDEGEEEDDKVLIDIEFIEANMYLYNMRTREFIIQGTNWEIILKELEKLFPGKVVLINTEHLEKAKNFK